MTTHVRADWLDGDAGADPWDRCAECHGLFGAGNRIKFPRLAGQDPYYIMKELHDFRHGLRTNDGGQMQKTATEVKKNDIPRVAKYFAAQTPPWPKQTIDAKVDLARARTLAIDGTHRLEACLDCHSEAQIGLLDKPIIGPRIAGQRDFYIAKELRDFRAGRRSKNDPERHDDQDRAPAERMPTSLGSPCSCRRTRSCTRIPTHEQAPPAHGHPHA